MSLSVTNSQVEIDGGYEGLRQLALIEAKNFISEDFLVRQLYYPYRLWKDKVDKKVTPVFLVYSNRLFHLYEYEFMDSMDYNSLVLVKHKRYSMESVDITLDEVLNIFKRTPIVPEPKVPFPQADSFERVINLCELLSQGDKTGEEISINYAFDPRQSDYYANAGRYLGLIQKHAPRGDDVVFTLTPEGRKILRLRYKERQLHLAGSILRHRVFREVFRLHVEHAEMPAKEEVMDIMKGCYLYQVQAESTFGRRASTIVGWINWILSLPR